MADRSDEEVPTARITVKGSTAIDRMRESAAKKDGTVQVVNSSEDYYLKNITPELLQHFSHEEASELVKYFFQTPSASTQGVDGTYDFNKIDENGMSFLEKELEGQNVIEFGNAGWRTNRHLQQFKLNSYEGVDPDYGKDALTHLMRQPDNSAIVCSFGVMESGVLDSWVGRDKPLGKYIDLLAKEIHRVTPQGAISLHGTDGFSELETAGFNKANVLYKGHLGDIVSYRK